MSHILKKKGGKVFAPKLPQRRPAVSTSAQSSARPSVERQPQTPSSHAHPVDIITISSDNDIPHVPDAPSSRTAQTTPHQPLETRRDDAAHPCPSIEASMLSSSTHAHNAALLPNTESVKRKTRDEDAGGEVPHKRHQSSTLDTPRSPSQPGPVDQPQFLDAQLQLAQPLESARVATSEPSQTLPQRTELPQPLEETSFRQDISSDEIPTIGISTNAESSQSGSKVQKNTAAVSRRNPSPEYTRVDPIGEAHVATTTSLGPAGATSGLGAAGDVGSRAEGGQLAETPVIVPMAPLNPDGTPGEPVQQSATGTKKKAPKRRKVQEAEDGDDVRATVEMHLNRPRRAPGKKQSGKRKNDPKKKNKRAETPEGADEEMINREELKMAELTRDLRIGKKFSRHDELRQREKNYFFKAQLAKNNPELAAMVEEVEEREEGGEPVLDPVEGQSRDDAGQSVIGGPQMRLVDGQIVLDENSLQVDRQSIARREQGLIEEVVEDEFTSITTCGTHMKREKAQLWDMAANEIFWKGLRMFGTDFEMIAKMFPHRNRRQIKLKFNKEEKDNPAKVDRILKQLNENSIDLDTYEEFSGVKLEEVADIKAEQDRIEAEQKAEEDRRISEQAEAERKKKETIAAQRAATQRALATSDHGEQLDYVENGDSGEKENQLRHNPKAKPGDKPVYHWTRQPEARTAEQLRNERENAPKKVYPWSQSANSKKTPKESGAKRGRKKKGALDETVQVLGDA